MDFQWLRFPARGFRPDHPSFGEIVDCVPREQAGIDDIQYLPGLLMPGMVNAHCHIELSHMKGKIPMQTGLVGFYSAGIVGPAGPG